MQAEQNIQYFSGPSMRAVLAEVRSTVGRDAIIMGQEQSNGRVRVAVNVESAMPRVKHINTFDTRRDARDPGTPKSELSCFSTLPTTGAFRLVGPPGSGKSTALANWALECRRLHPDRTITIVAPRDQRFGADGWLKRVCELAGFAFVQGDDKVAKKVAEKGAAGEFVLVDTVSEDALTAIKKVTDVSVLPATQTAEARASWLPDGCDRLAIITQLDRVASAEDLLQELAACGGRLLGLSTSRQIPGALKPASDEWMARLMQPSR